MRGANKRVRRVNNARSKRSLPTRTERALLYLPACLGGNIRLSYAARLSVNRRLTAWAQGRAHRKPILLFLLFGFLLLRFAARKLSVLVLFHEPPRNTRVLPGVPMQASARTPTSIPFFQQTRLAWRREAVGAKPPHPLRIQRTEIRAQSY